MIRIVERMNDSIKVGYLYLILGLACITICIVVSFNTYSFLEKANSANGVVIELVKKHSSKSSLYPKIEFTDLNGNSIVFTSSFGLSPSINTYQKGDVVKVLYQSNSTDSAKVSSFFSLWGISFLLFIVGSVFTFSSIRKVVKLNASTVDSVT
jgi:sulfite reductase alpha subunit-like flavoprotein